jgi:hypothetical protein
MVLVHQLDGFTDRVPIGTTVQQLVTFDCRFVHSVLFDERRLGQKRVNRIGIGRLRGDIRLLVASHKIECTVTNIACLERSSTLLNFVSCLLWLSRRGIEQGRTRDVKEGVQVEHDLVIVDVETRLRTKDDQS